MEMDRLFQCFPQCFSDFSHLLKSYVDSVTKRDIAHLERSMSNMTLEKNQSSIRRSTYESYENKMKAQQFNTEEEFQRLHESLQEEALREFEKKRAMSLMRRVKMNTSIS